MTTFSDKWNKLTPAQQAAVKAETEKKIAEGYDPKKIEEEVIENYGKQNNNNYNDKREEKEIKPIDDFKNEFIETRDRYTELKEQVYNTKTGEFKEGVTDELIEQYHEVRDKAKEMHRARNDYNYEIPESQNDMKETMKNDKGRSKALTLGASYHQNGVPLSDEWNTKYTHVDGREVIYDKDGNKVTTDENLGTYNFFPGKALLEHNKYDVGPYAEFGNSMYDTVSPSERTSNYKKLEGIIKQGEEYLNNIGKSTLQNYK